MNNKKFVPLCFKSDTRFNDFVKDTDLYTISHVEEQKMKVNKNSILKTYSKRSPVTQANEESNVIQSPNCGLLIRLQNGNQEKLIPLKIDSNSLKLGAFQVKSAAAAPPSPIVIDDDSDVEPEKKDQSVDNSLAEDNRVNDHNYVSFKKAKTSTERVREHRERVKRYLTKAGTFVDFSSKVLTQNSKFRIVKSKKAKSPAQRAREYRARQKKRNVAVSELGHRWKQWKKIEGEMEAKTKNNLNTVTKPLQDPLGKTTNKIIQYKVNLKSSNNEKIEISEDELSDEGENNTDEIDEDKCFLLSFLSSFKQLDRSNKMWARLEFIKVMQTAIEKQEGKDQLSKSKNPKLRRILEEEKDSVDSNNLEKKIKIKVENNDEHFEEQITLFEHSLDQDIIKTEPL